MAVLLCRCCGAPLELKQNISVCKCEYCGVQQTVPILDFDEKALLWERADNMRRSGEYDRAMSIYEQIAKLCPDEPDVYWEMVLCRYGVEYVEEPVSHKRIPTINRIQYTPVIDDKDYRKAVSLVSNGDQRRIYILEAQRLDGLREDILAVSLNEKPYDIFICYKETDSDGRRTEDSVLASKLYRTLSAEGWRVFFSRITLESKAGTEYEPYIFSALNSAKLMFVVGTSPDNINAVWVRNEWSRYLARMTENGEGMLVPLYKGMHKEHLPAEFSHLQAFDMCAPDFEEELVRGVRKLLTKSSDMSAIPVQTGQTADISGLLRRAQLFLEDMDFARADELCETVLDSEPENARAYLIKLLVEYHVSSEEKLAECCSDFTTSRNYAKAMRFGDESFCARLSEQAELSRKKAAELSARKTAEETERIYQNAVKLLSNETVKADCLEAAALLKKLGDYKDSRALAVRCNEIIAAINEKAEQEAAERAAAERFQREQRRKTRKITLLSGIGAAALFTVIISGAKISSAISLSQRYNTAENHLASGSYDEAIIEFAALGNYSDSSEKLYFARYEKACSLFESGEFAQAEKLFTELSGYSDSSVQVQRVKYAQALAMYEAGDFTGAASAFDAVGEYSDSREYALKSRYSAAEQAESAGSFDEAAEYFVSLGEYSDSPERVNECLYKNACRLSDEGDYTEALKIFSDLGNYQDSEDKIIQTKYLKADKLLSDEKYDDAVAVFSDIADYSDSAERLKMAYYMQGSKLLSEHIYDGALSAFRLAGDYSDAEALVTETQYQRAGQYAADERYMDAADSYELLGNYKDSAKLAKEMKYLYAVKMRETGYYDSAAAIFAELGDYSDSALQVTETENAKRRDLQHGDTVKLGGWVQGKNGEYEPLEWIVLKREGGRVLVTTKYLVDFMQYGALTWKESSVRSWLSGTFYSNAFTAAEKKAIAEVTLTDKNGNETTDRVFILSREEAFEYLTKETLRTDYTEWGEKKLRDAVTPTLAPGVSYASRFGDPYWLRDIGDELRVCCLNSTGGFSSSTLYNEERIGVRPAMWIELGEL